jgi:hypothetical protein
MIQTVLRREFHVACDGCGQTTTPQSTADQAYEWAFDHNWQPITSLCGFAFMTTWLCPACQTQREAV